MRITNTLNIIIVLSLGLLLFNCKEEVKNTTESEAVEVENDSIKTAKQSDGLILFTGKFVYLADAAILETKTGIYGVVINEKMHELNDMVKGYKTEDTDFVPVAIRGILMEKPKEEEGWDYRIEIKEIIEVYEPNPEEDEVIKIGN